MPTRLYHITHVANLPAIVAAGGLCCDAERARRSLRVTGIAHQHIKNRRAKRVVPVAAGGTLADYVPFYFASRSPMLYTIHRGNVEGYVGGQAGVIHLCCVAEDVMASRRAWCFSDGHAEMEISRLYDDWSDSGNIDWPLMEERIWADNAADNDRNRRRQAEFLLREFAPWSLVRFIGVYNAAALKEVRQTLPAEASKPRVEVRRHWYYD